MWVNLAEPPEGTQASRLREVEIDNLTVRRLKVSEEPDEGPDYGAI